MQIERFEQICREKSLLGFAYLTTRINWTGLPPDERKAVLAGLKNQFLERCTRKIKYHRMHTKKQAVTAICRQAKDVWIEWIRKHIRDEAFKRSWSKLHKGDVQESELSSMEVKDQLAVIRRMLEKEEFELFYYRGFERLPFWALSKMMNKRPDALRKQFGRVRIKIRKFFPLL